METAALSVNMCFRVNSKSDVELSSLETTKMVATRLEVNFKRLLNRCEILARERKENDWRLEKFVGALQEQLNEIRKSPGKPSQETLAEYSRKLEFLKGILSTEKLASPTERAIQTDLLTPALRSSENAGPSRELHLQTKAKYERQMRDDLLGTEDTGPAGVRQRQVPGAATGSGTEDFDAVLKYHNSMQERITEEMVQFAQHLKEDARMAGRIVQDDNKKLEKSRNQADSNMTRLDVESKRLDKHVANSCNWWVWIMLVVVCVTFIWMVLFMKMFPKR